MNTWPVGEVREIQGSGSSPYKAKNVDDTTFSCTCPAWRNQGKTPPAERTCKHLKTQNGTSFEEQRVAANRGGQPAIQVAQSAVQTAPVVQLVSSVKTENAIEQEIAQLRQVSGATLRRERPRLEAEIEATIGRKMRQDEKAKFFGPPVLLANDWWDVDNLDPAGWWMSEKLDGVRAFWSGEQFESRQGNLYPAPAWFRAALPNHPLDGELWMGRQMFQKTISIVKTAVADDRWYGIKYVIFDAPHLKTPFEDRLEFLKSVFPSKNDHAFILDQTKCTGETHLMDELKRLGSAGAEGVMLRKPGSLYEAKRSSTLLKVKQFHDAEGVVKAHKPGKGRHKGRLGAVVVELPNGKTFDVGSGFSDFQRENPPKIGVTITYRFTELTNDGVPKCGSFVAERNYE